MITLNDLNEIATSVWEIPASYRSDMRVPARIYCSRDMLNHLIEDRSLEQAVNVATLPGIEGYSIAMPDIHQGYGFPIGGVAAIRTEDGVISPGGVGYDINCGVRLLTSPYKASDLSKEIENLAHQIQRCVPSGIGRGGPLNPGIDELDKILNTGVHWAVKQGYAEKEDLEAIEEYGCYEGADASCVSENAKKRGLDQIGTIGSGNHFVEIQKVEDVYLEEVARAFGLFKDQLCIMIHTGSRGLGHQICTDYVRLMNQVMAGYNIHLPDRELASAPFKSPEGQKYFGAMAAAANFAWTNRQLITYQIRNVFHSILKEERALKLPILYDVAHNIAKKEVYKGIEYIVHRKGATRAFGPGSPEISEKYRKFGQPVMIPGSMGTSSYILIGTEKAMEESFGSTCHGAGRSMSRMKARRTLDYNQLRRQLSDKGVVVRAGSASGLLEEAPEAYKDVCSVVNVVEETGISKKVARLIPLAVIKG